jgi:hypothetical protein
MDMHYDRRLALADYLRGLAIGELLDEVRTDAEEALLLAIDMLTHPLDDDDASPDLPAAAI